MATLSGDIAIVGGGLAGLYLAVLLQEQGRSVKLFESSAEVGGVIRSSRSNGFLLEHGPNSALLRPPVERAISRLALDAEVIDPSPEAKYRYLGRELKGPLTPLPTSPLAAIRSPILSPRAKLRLLKEPFIRRTTDEDQSVADFISHRFGPEVTEELVAPMLSGIWAADISRLSMRSALPKVWNLAADHGSILRGLLEQRKTRGQEPRRKYRLISFKNGMQSLPSACLSRLQPDTVALQTPVTKLNREDGKVRLEFADGKEGGTFRQVVLSCPADRTAALIAPFDYGLAEQIRQIPYAPLGVLHFAIETDGLSHALNGFGFLVPPNRDQAVLGAIFSSSLFDNRAPEGFHLLTCMVGGGVHPESANVDDAAVQRQVEAELSRFIGAKKPFHLLQKSLLPSAIPNYPLGHHRLVWDVEEFQRKNPQILVLGNWLRGISVPDRLEEAERAAGVLMGG